ncbi:MAG: disulfide bond formation protein B [Reyranella sp.]|uniref:disulfide bond formation protein B n=1 Tax=Reyranella sp. TaxID=1929291 RepID=UPI00121662C1|nr:disulfide bond formation protein B [Reyranella sp.]TAJ38360.1 MAG: disulfide bond formation protein B [Reyranella sp.]
MGQLVRLGNAAGAAAIAVILLIAFGLQFGLKELPCPLCNLQRAAFVLCGFGFLLNLRFGIQPLHYGLTLLGALFGLVASGFQALLYIAPGTAAHGAPVLGLHLYTWSLLLSFAVIAFVAVLMIFSGRPEHHNTDHQTALRFRGVSRLAAYLLIAATLANAANSFLLCGPAECSDNPTSYWISKYLPS